METRYNVYFAGQLLEGKQEADVRARLAKLFNADQQTLDKLFSGKSQLLKSNCDKPTALKYKQAMERAGAMPIVRVRQDDAARPSPQAAASATPVAAPPVQQPMTAAQKIAALAAAPDEDRFKAAADSEEATPSVPKEKADSADGGPEVAPAGVDILHPHERRAAVTSDIDISGIEIGAATARLAPESPVPPPAPDTNHLQMGEVGESIPGLPAREAPPPPDTADITLAPGDTDLTEFSPPDAEPPVLDISDINLAPVGADVLEEQYRRRDNIEAPTTDHISLQE